MGQDPLARYEQYRVKTVPPTDPNAGQRNPLSALSKATGISAAPEDPQYRYPADTPKGPGRFLSEAYKNSPLNVSAVKDTLTEFLRNPVLTPVNIVNNTLDDMRSQARKALDHIQTNRTLDAANDIILAFPLLGPMVRRGMEQIEKGDPAGGLGAITGAVSQLAAPEVIARSAGQDTRAPAEPEPEDGGGSDDRHRGRHSRGPRYRKWHPRGACRAASQ